jgi:hypothetical protein
MLMTRISPTREGFRLALRQPPLTFAEIAWRWTVGASVAAVIGFTLAEYLDSLPLSRLDQALLKTKQPLLVAQTMTHLLHGTLERAVIALLLAAIGCSILWIFASSFGRLAIVRAMMEHFRGEESPSCAAIRQASMVRSLIGLNFLRVALALAGLLALLASAVAASSLSTGRKPHELAALLVSDLLALIVCVVWAQLNWQLSLASMFVIRGENTIGAISTSVVFVREQFASIFAVSIWNILAHIAALLGAASGAAFILVFVQVISTRLIIAGVVLVTLTYFALVDWLYIARLAGYVCVAEMPETEISPAPSPMPIPAAGNYMTPTPASTTSWLFPVDP